MEQKINLEDLLNEISNIAEQDKPMGANWWINKTQQLHTLTRPYLKALFQEQQKLALKQLEIMDDAKNSGEKMSVSEAELRIRTTKEWLDVETTKGMLKWVEEEVKIAKKRSMLEQEDKYNNF